MKTCFSILCCALWIHAAHSQDAVLPTKDETTPSGTPAIEVTPLPAVSATPKAKEDTTSALKKTAQSVPDLSQLDEMFKQTSLGKDAEEFRLHVQAREIANRVVNEPGVIAAKRLAQEARTDLEKRERLRDYYEIYYGRMGALAGSAELKHYLETEKADHLKLLDQPRVRPRNSAAPKPSNEAEE